MKKFYIIAVLILFCYGCEDSHVVLDYGKLEVIKIAINDSLEFEKVKYKYIISDGEGSSYFALYTDKEYKIGSFLEIHEKTVGE